MHSVTATSQTRGRSEEKPAILPTVELVASYANLPIPQAEALLENSPPPPCPISNMPTDILIEILKHVALLDPVLLYRMSLVCRRLAYHFAHEQHIWKQLCQGWRFGFEAMHYSFSCDIYGNPNYTLAPRYVLFPRDVSVQIPKPLSSWSQVFQVFPRIRFTGVYISTVNYTRPGAASAYQNITWNSPIHIVTYFRYLRFYPDGTVISLLTTTEPKEVVPYINKENMLTARAMTQRQHQHHAVDPGASLSGAVDPLPPIVMATLRHALRGCWHLVRPHNPSGNDDTPSTSQCPSIAGEAQSAGLSDPRDVVIETEGVDPKYIYTMHLSLRSPSKSSNPSASNSTKNTRLAWKGFWSYNKLTDDWAEFALRNDKAYVFRRVRGWGMD